MNSQKQNEDITHSKNSMEQYSFSACRYHLTSLVAYHLHLGSRGEINSPTISVYKLVNVIRSGCD